ncbi:hypothetical protein GCM10007363_15160 [Pseudomonas fluvialis]|jgi:bacterioferritin-associated ferredoxin|nr:hypothetical protein GCM10007363_15160 [Pseudomonas fluvialis]
MGVTDGHIREAIMEGCSSYAEVRQATEVGTQCGKCACMAKQVFRDSLADLHNAQAMAVSAPFHHA